MPLNDLDWALGDLSGRLPAYSLYRAYYDGDHRLLFATEKFLNAFADLFREFADNYCDDVVDAMGDRLQVEGWSTEDKRLQAVVDDLWHAGSGEGRFAAVRRNGLREGDGFSIVQRDPRGVVRSYRQDPTHMAVRYSNDLPDDLDVAAKVWRSGKRYRANLYYPDGRIEKYASKGAGADGGTPGVRAFDLLKAGDPGLKESEESGVVDTGLGMPVFHYPNGDLSEYGRSILRGVIPLQDALNKSIADMLVTMEGVAAPTRAATGIQPEYNPTTGEQIDPFAGANKPGAVIRTGNKDAKFIQFPSERMDGFLDVQDAFKVELARKGYMPPHAVPLRSGSGAVPSGLSLLVTEGRTVKYANDRQREWGLVRRREMAYQASLAMGAEVTANDLTLNWAPAATRDTLALLEELTLKKELGVPTGQVLKEAGYSQKEVDDFLEQADQEERTEADVFSVLQGGRGSVTPAGARALNGATLPPAPAATV